MRVTLAIPGHPPSGECSSDIAVQLIGMGGRLTGWQPETNGSPARALFSFDTEEERERFVALALDVPGVSLVTPIEPDYTQEYVSQSAIL